MPPHVTLPADSNQALGLANFAIDFLTQGQNGARPDRSVLDRVNLFYTDACLCGVSALALGTNAPVLLREEALQYPAPTPGMGTLAGTPWARKAMPC